MTYDASDNARQCYSLAIKEIRLRKIRQGVLSPRTHVPEEMRAYREGKNGRRAIAVAVGGALSLVAALAYLSHEWPPQAKDGAAIAMQQEGAIP